MGHIHHITLYQRTSSVVNLKLLGSTEWDRYGGSDYIVKGECKSGILLSLFIFIIRILCNHCRIGVLINGISFHSMVLKEYFV